MACRCPPAKAPSTKRGLAERSEVWGSLKNLLPPDCLRQSVPPLHRGGLSATPLSLSHDQGQNIMQTPAIAALTGTYSAKMQRVRLFVVSEQLRPHNALYLRIKMRKEVRMAEQYPVKKADVVQLHDVKHRQKPHKEPPESEPVPHAVPCSENDRPGEQQNRKQRDEPAEQPRPAEPLFLLRRDRVKNLLRRGAEKPLLLDQPDPGIQQ